MLEKCYFLIFNVITLMALIGAKPSEKNSPFPNHICTHTHTNTHTHTHTHAHTQTICDMGRTQGDLKDLCCIKITML